MEEMKMSGAGVGAGEEDLTVEQSFALLDEMVEKLQSSDISLEESFRIYQNGMNLLKDVSGKIETFEKKMQVLAEGGEAGEFH